MPPKKNNKITIPPPPGEDASPEELLAYFETYDLSELEAAGYVDRLSPEEIRESDELANACKARIAARTNRNQLQLTMTLEQLQKFTLFANQKQIPPSTLASSWVLERLEHELRQS